MLYIITVFRMGFPMAKGQTDSGQHARFIETAKALECDEDEARFKEKLGKIARAKVPAEKKASK
jgi:hypothetical protein